ncbi:hypothetical protein C8F04DRAFT_1091019 [Mycena alexandri]|uniref:Uncharacterized protein n=1 Tax=Mycena alexandri TaxID=1745969 RepID=A0AAD6T3Y3_9AGAR|nr:hypothetical protein C8F04DRAFT_1091019 [Mycena alexandri]
MWKPIPPLTNHSRSSYLLTPVMSPSMPIPIPASSASSMASSPSSSPSSSKSGVYIPVHKRTRSDRAVSELKRTLLIYTPAELMQLAQSPLSRHLSAATHAALHAQEELAVIALSKRQQRSRDYMQHKNVEHVKELKNNNTVAVVVASAAAPRRRPAGRASERSSNSRRNVASRFMDAASWRGQSTRHMEALPVSLAFTTLISCAALQVVHVRSISLLGKANLFARKLVFNFFKAPRFGLMPACRKIFVSTLAQSFTVRYTQDVCKMYITQKLIAWGQASRGNNTTKGDRNALELGNPEQDTNPHTTQRTRTATGDGD